jgi:cytochrome b6-f complex iron-sulfur subunit
MRFHRRDVIQVIFGSALWLGLAALGAVGALWAAAVARLMSPNVTNRPPSTFRAGLPTDYADGCVETKYRQTRGVWIVRGEYRGGSRIYALRTACTHLGCMTIWQESRQKFQCPCHGSGFSKEGINVEGPAPRPLERCAIRIAEDGQLEIDCGRTFQEQLGEWDEPESYVLV